MSKKIRTIIIAVISIIVLISLIILARLISKKITIDKICNNYEKISSVLTDEIKDECNKNGNISIEQSSQVLKKLLQKSFELKDDGLIENVYCNPEKDSSVLIEFCDGIRFIYSPTVENTLSGSGKASVVTIEPYSDDFIVRFNTNVIADGTTGPTNTAKLISKEFKGLIENKYTFKQGDSFEAIINGFKSNSAILWQGHGDYNEKVGSVLCLNVADERGAFRKCVNKYYKDIKDGSVYMGKEYQLVLTSKFFYSMKKDTLSNSIVYLGACYSLTDAYGIPNDDKTIFDENGKIKEKISLYDSILSAGASAVVGNTNSISIAYNADMMYDLFDGFTQKKNNNYYTLKQALEFAKEKRGYKDPVFLVSVGAEVHALAKNEDIIDCTLEEILTGKQKNNDKNKPKYEMVKEINIEADSISYYDSTVGYDFAVIKKDNKYGLINYDGEIIVPIEYASIEVTNTTPAATETKLFAFDDENNSYWIERDGTVIPTEFGGWGYEGGAEVYWYDGPIMFDYEKGEKEYSYEAYMAYNHGSNVLGTITHTSADIIPIQEISGYQVTQEGGYASYSVNKVSEKYALFNLKTKKLITDFIFDNYGTSGFVEGILPVEQGGKWGYVTEKGKMITDFLYDVSHKTEWNNNQMYSALNGYIIVKQNDKWGLIDKKGTVIVNTEFDGISQVDNNGRFWLGSNGKWSVFKITK